MLLITLSIGNISCETRARGSGISRKSSLVNIEQKREWLQQKAHI